MTPGNYLALRRNAVGMSPEDVAARIYTDPRWPEQSKADHIRLIEADATPASFSTIMALRTVYAFDLDVLAQLDLAAVMPSDRVDIPDICIVCGCTDADPCLLADGNCGWSDGTHTLCTHCAAHLSSPPAPASVGAGA